MGDYTTTAEQQNDTLGRVDALIIKLRRYSKKMEPHHRNSECGQLIDASLFELERLEFTILDHCCTCGAGENEKREHAHYCVAVKMLD